MQTISRLHTRLPHRHAALVAALVLAIAYAGCGQSSDDAAVRTVTEQFFAALDADDGESACADLTAGTRAALESQEKIACRDAVTQLDISGGRVESAQVYGREALVELSTGDAAFLNREQDGWRLSAAGCTPVGDGPYDCELED